MDQTAILHAFDRQMRREIQFPDMRKDELPWGVRFIRPAPGMSIILYYDLDEDNADQAIQEQEAYFRQLNQRFTWKVFDHDHPADMKTRLTRQGFIGDEPAALMVLDLEHAPAGLFEPVQADIRKVISADQLGDVVKVLETVWGGNYNWVLERMGNHLQIPDYLDLYLAYQNHQPASVGWTYFYPRSQFGQLFGGSTVPEQRRRGLYTAILARRVQAAAEQDLRFLTVEAGAESQPILEKNGFWRLSGVQDFEKEQL
jgi:hypothetical protein